MILLLDGQRGDDVEFRGVIAAGAGHDEVIGEVEGVGRGDAGVEGSGLGTRLRATARKKASWRASMARIEAGPCTILESVRARPEIRFMTAPMPVLVMMLARARNSEGFETGKSYLQGAKVRALLALRIPSAVATWICS